MFRTMTLAASLAALAATASPAAAASWEFSGAVGPRVYYGPPPVHLQAPVIYRRAPMIYRQAPVVVGPAPAPIYDMEAPEDIIESLQDAGFTELSPITRRGAVYRLNAVDPEGNVVALDISIFTGEIERSRILQARFQAAPAPAPRPVARAAPSPAPVEAAAPPPAAARPTGTPPSTLRERLEPVPDEAGEGDRDPLVVY